MALIWILTALVLLTAAVTMLGALESPAWLRLADGWPERFFGLLLAELCVLGIALWTAPPPASTAAGTPAAAPSVAPAPAGPVPSTEAAWDLAQAGDLVGASAAFAAALDAAPDAPSRAAVQVVRLDYLQRYLLDPPAVRAAADDVLATCPVDHPGCTGPRAWAYYYKGVVLEREAFDLKDPRFIAADEAFSLAMAGGLPVAARVRAAMLYHYQRKKADKVGLDYLARRDALAAEALAHSADQALPPVVASDLLLLQGKVTEFAQLKSTYTDERTARVRAFYEQADAACAHDRVCRAWLHLNMGHLLRDASKHQDTPEQADQARALADASYAICLAEYPMTGAVGDRGRQGVCYRGKAINARNAADARAEETEAADPSKAVADLRRAALHYAEAERAYGQSTVERYRVRDRDRARQDHDRIAARLP